MNPLMRVNSGAVMLLASCACTGMTQDKPGGTDNSTQAVPSVLQQSPAHHKQTLSEFLTRRAAMRAIFAGATNVESFRLVPHGSEKPLGRIQQWMFFAKGVPQHALFATRLSKIVLDPQTFTFPYRPRKHCMFDPGVAFRVWHYVQYVDVVICFKCNQAVIFKTHPDTTDFSDAQAEEPVMRGDVDSARPALIALTKEALAGDPVFSKLEEQKPPIVRTAF